MMQRYGNEYGSMMSFGFGSGFFGFIMMILLFILVIWLVVEFTGWTPRSGGSNRAPHEISALDIAKKRYAKGEIDGAQYKAIKNELTQ